MDHQNRDGRRRHPRNAGCLAKRDGANLGKLLLQLIGKTGQALIVEVLRNFDSFQTLKLFDFLHLALNISVIFHLDFNLPGHFRVYFAQLRPLLTMPLTLPLALDLDLRLPMLLASALGPGLLWP